MKYHFLIILSLSFIVKSYSQTISQNKIESQSIPLTAEEKKEFSKFTEFKLLNINMSRLSEFLSDTNKVTLEIQMDLGDGTKTSLTLFRNNIISEDLIRERKEQKNAQEDLSIYTFSGYNNGNIDNKVRISLTRNGINGYIENANEMYFLERTTNLEFGGLKDKGNLVVYKGIDFTKDKTTCAVDEANLENSLIESLSSEIFTSSSLSVTDNCYVLSLATDADYEFYQYYGAQSNNEIYP